MKKTNTLLIFMATILVLGILSLPVMAGSYEIAITHPYYIHPVSGIIEDAGNNPGIGQGMTENVLHGQALVETDDNGMLYATVRYNLHQYMKNVSFAVQNRGDTQFYQVDYQVMQETGETCDYRFPIPAKDAIMRSTFFVGPMGRDVVFYFDFSDYTPGNTDFILSVSDTPPAPTPTPTPTPTPAPTPQPTPQPAPTMDAASLGTAIETIAVNDLMSAGDLGYDHGLLTNDSPELADMKPTNKDDKRASEENGEETSTEPQQKPAREPGFYTKALFIFLLAIIGMLITVGALTIAAMFILLHKPSEKRWDK